MRSKHYFRIKRKREYCIFNDDYVCGKGKAIVTLFSRFDDESHGICMPSRCRRVASRQPSIFSLRGRHVAVVSPRIGLREARAKWKIARCPGRNWSVPRPWVLPFVRHSRYRFDPRWICVVLCAKGRAQVLGSTSRNRRQFSRSAFGNTEALPLFLSRRWKGLLPSSYVFIHFYLSASVCQLFFTYVHRCTYVHTYGILYARKDTRILATYPS